MSKQKKSTMVLAILMVFAAVVIFMPGMAKAGNLEPSAPPGSTMKTLDEIPPTWSQTLSASDRFELVLSNEAVLDKETGLVWAKDANIDGIKDWEDAVIYCRDLTIGGRKGWRLPMVEELARLVDPSQSNPSLPSGHPFDNVQSLSYWSATTRETVTTFAWFVHMYNGSVVSDFMSHSYYVWPVRGGAGPILVPY